MDNLQCKIQTNTSLQKNDLSYMDISYIWTWKSQEMDHEFFSKLDGVVIIYTHTHKKGKI